MTQGDVHDNHGTYSAYEYATGKYAMPVTVVPGIPSAGVAGTEVQGTSAAGSTTNQGYPVRLGAKYKATPATRTDGQTSDLVTDAAENLMTTLGTALKGLISGVETDSILALVGKRADSFQVTITSANATSATDVKAKTASKKIYITDLVISVDTAMNVQLQDDTGTPVVIMEQMYFPANSIFSKTFSTPLEVPTNKDLEVITSAAGNISVTAAGYVI